MSATYERALQLAQVARDTSDAAALIAEGWPTKLARQTGAFNGRIVTRPEPLETAPAVIVCYIGQRRGSVRLIVPETGEPRIRVDSPAPAAEAAMAALLDHLTTSDLEA